MTGSDAWVDIGFHWRLVAWGMECALDIRLSVDEVNRVLDDAPDDQVGTKQYTFLDQHGIFISGRVDEHEPETLRLSVHGHRELERRLSTIVGDARLIAHERDA